MRRALAILVSAAAACVAIPAGAAQAVPACGTTLDQWVGVFPGVNHNSWGDTPLDHTITLANGVLAVDTLVNDWKRLPPYGTPELTGNSLTWKTAETFPRGPGESSIYVTSGVTCANGVVQSFTGTEYWAYGVVMQVIAETESPFEANRS